MEVFWRTWRAWWPAILLVEPWIPWRRRILAESTWWRWWTAIVMIPIERIWPTRIEVGLWRPHRRVAHVRRPRWPVSRRSTRWWWWATKVRRWTVVAGRATASLTAWRLLVCRLLRDGTLSARAARSRRASCSPIGVGLLPRGASWSWWMVRGQEVPWWQVRPWRAMRRCRL